MSAPAPTITLPSDAEMPMIGLGTWQLTGQQAADGVAHALELGYRLIDTSGDYGNQRQIGSALHAAPIGRDEVFVVTKVEEDEDAYESTERKLEELGTERVDLCLLHRPPPDGAGEELWEGLLAARRDGLARDVGVSNYTAEQVDRLVDATGETPAVNQIEWSPFGHSDRLLAHHRDRRVVIQAYSPLTRAQRLEDDRLREIAADHEKTPAQVLLRWDIERGTPPVPKAASAEHREENLEIFDFELDEAEVASLNGLNERYSALAGLPYE